MPHGESWFNLLPFFADVEDAATLLSAPVNDEGVTWIAHGPIGVQHVFGLALVLAILLLMGLITRIALRDPKRAVVPEDKLTVRTFVELFVSTIYSMMSDIMGKKAAKFFLPLIGTCAFVILISNLIGLVPGFTPPTDSLNTTVMMSLVIFFTTHIFGLKENGLAYLKHFLGPVLVMAPLMLGTLVCVVQTLVFCILSTVYISMAIEHHEHEEAHH